VASEQEDARNDPLRAAFTHYCSLYGSPSAENIASIRRPNVSAAPHSARTPAKVLAMARRLLIGMDEPHLFFISHMRLAADLPVGWRINYGAPVNDVAQSDMSQLGSQEPTQAPSQDSQKGSVAKPAGEGFEGERPSASSIARRTRYLFEPTAQEYDFHPAEAYFLALATAARDSLYRAATNDFLECVDDMGKEFLYNFASGERKPKHSAAQTSSSSSSHSKDVKRSAAAAKTQRSVTWCKERRSCGSGCVFLECLDLNLFGCLDGLIFMSKPHGFRFG
jgi:hypothetical protein